MAIVQTHAVNDSADKGGETGGTRLRLAGKVLPLAMVLLTTGCVSTSTSLWPFDDHCFGKPCQIVCVWQNHVMEVPDSVNNGAPLKGFAGRVYFFGQNIDYPMLTEGMLTVDLIDETCDPPKWIERWNIDPVTLQRLKKKDMMGWGYTVFLPSQEYYPQMSKIKLRTAFQTAENTAPIFTENAVTLDSVNGHIAQRNSPGPIKMGPLNAPATTPTLPPPTATGARFQPPIPLR